MIYERVLQSVTVKGYWDLLFKHSQAQGGGKLQSVVEDHPEIINTVLLKDFTVDDGVDISEELLESEKGVLNLPFPVCLFEDTDKNLFNMSDDSGGGAFNKGQVLPDCKAMVVVEFNPGDYGFILFLRDGRSTWSIDKNSWVYTTAFSVCQMICDFVNSRKTVMGTVQERIKVKTSRGNHFIKKVVVCGPHKLRDKTVSIGSRNVSWSHQWSVRGHWRRVPSVGKDREGNTINNGYTWVIPHVKGPESSQLVNKVRIVNCHTDNPNTPIGAGHGTFLS